MKASTKSTARHTDVPCPFCSLLCDDLVIESSGCSITVKENACIKAAQEFNRPISTDTPKINGQHVTLEEAISYAASILKNSQQPLFAGLGTDVNGMRAVMDIADQTGAIIDHMHGKSSSHNFRVLQDSGWINTTLMEVKNRADLIILAGTDTTAFPRFFERVILNKTTLFNKYLKNREVIYLGNRATSKLKAVNAGKVKQLTFDTSRLGEIISALRALLRSQHLQTKKIAGVNIKDLQTLAEKIQSANYGVIVWSPADLDWEHADLAIHAICGLVKDMNLTTRFVGLPLGGNEGGMSAAGVCAWQSGYPLRVNYASGHPKYDLRYATESLLDRNDVDALVWISSISSNIQPPQTTTQTIALTTPGTYFKSTPAVYIPIGTPGIDHPGRMIRCDSVVSHTLPQLRESNLPDLASILGALQKAI